MKKKLCVGMVALLIFSLIAGCGAVAGSGETTGGNTTTESTEKDGLTAAFIGDSITYGVGVNDEDNLYYRRLEKALGFAEVTAYGVKGSCVSAASTMGMQSSPLAKRVHIFKPADVMFLYLGTNDFACDTPLGTMEDTMDLSFYGAWNYSIKYLKENHPETKLILMTPTPRVGVERNNQKLTMEDYAEAIRKVGAAHDIPVIDLYAETVDQFTLLTYTQYLPDKLHLNDAGHGVIAQIIESWWAENKDTLFPQ